MKKTLKWLIFIAYIAALVYFMFFAEILGRTDVSRTYRYNLVPFKEIKRFVNHFWQLGLTAVLANIAGNVVAFMPFGFCLPLIADHRIKFFGCMLYTFGLSLAIELIQLVIQNCQRQEHLRFLIGIELLMERQRVHLVFHIGILMHQLIADAEIIVLAQFQQALPFVDRPAHHAAGN